VVRRDNFVQVTTYSHCNYRTCFVIVRGRTRRHIEFKVDMKVSRWTVLSVCVCVCVLCVCLPPATVTGWKKSSVVNSGFYIACNIHDINIYRCFGKAVSNSNSPKPAAYKGAFHLSISQLISMSGCSTRDLRFSPYDQIVEVLLLRHLLASKNLWVTNFWKVSRLISVQLWLTSFTISDPGFF
jgi:hypothetical protein